MVGWKNPAGIGSKKVGRSNMSQGTLTTSHTLQCAVVSFNKSKLPSMHDTSLAWLTRSLPATKQVDDGGWSSEKLGVTAG